MKTEVKYDIKTLQFKYFGHIMRYSTIMKTILKKQNQSKKQMDNNMDRRTTSGLYKDQHDKWTGGQHQSYTMISMTSGMMRTMNTASWRPITTKLPHGYDRR